MSTLKSLRQGVPAGAVLTREQAQAICEKTVGMSKADAINVTLTSNHNSNVRFADNQMSTAGATTDAFVGIQSSFGPKHAVVTTNDLSEASLRRCVEQSEVLARLDQVTAPDLASLPSAAAIAERALNDADARQHIARTLGDPASSAPAYGAYTFLTAAAGAAQTNASTSTVLDCPIDVDVDLIAWLRLAERLLARGNVLPSFFWFQEGMPRLLLSLRPEDEPRMMCRPSHVPARLVNSPSLEGETISVAGCGGLGHFGRSRIWM